MKSLAMPTLFGLVILLFPLIAAAEEPTDSAAIGQKPPAIELQSLLNAPPDAQANWDALKGKVVVLEFWATWCGPCVEAIPHMNELTDAFHDRPVQFIAITEENESTIKEFLAKKPIHGWVGLNTDKSMHHPYGIDAIPHTVIVGADGKIVAITHPANLEAKHLENILAGKESGLPAPTKQERVLVGQIPGDSSGQPPIFQIVIRRSNSETKSGGGGKAGSNEFGIIYGRTFQGATVSELLRSAYGVTASQLVVEAPLAEGTFDVFIQAPGKGYRQSLFADAVESTFNLTSQKTTRDIETFVLTIASSGKRFQTTATPKNHSTSGRTGNDGAIDAVNITMSRLAHSLESMLGKPVIDETGLTDGYDINVKWQQKDIKKPDPAELIEPLRSQLGLELTLTKRPIEVIVVKSQDKEK